MSTYLLPGESKMQTVVSSVANRSGLKVAQLTQNYIFYCQIKEHKKSDIGTNSGLHAYSPVRLYIRLV